MAFVFGMIQVLHISSSKIMKLGIVLYKVLIDNILASMFV